MISGLKSIRKERAILERDRVLIGSMMEDAKIADGFDAVVNNFFEGVSDEEIEELINRIPESDDEDEQVNRVLTSTEDLDVDGILGLDDEDEASVEV